MIKRRSYNKRKLKRKSITRRTRRKSQNFGSSSKLKWALEKITSSPVKKNELEKSQTPETPSISSLVEPILGLKTKYEKEYFKGMQNYIDTAANQFIIPPVEDKDLTLKQKFIKWFITTSLGKKYIINFLDNLKHDVENGKNLNNLVSIVTKS